MDEVPGTISEKPDRIESRMSLNILALNLFLRLITQHVSRQRDRGTFYRKSLIRFDLRTRDLLMHSATPQHTRRSIWLASAAVVGLGSFAAPFAGAASVPGTARIDDVALQGNLALNQYDFGHEGILGTSMDLTVRAASRQKAEQCEQQVLAEIERLRAILSTYDPVSEINRVKAGAAIESSELAELLSTYQTWSDRTGGVLSVNMAEIIRVWKTASATDTLPRDEAIREALSAAKAWNVDALGKGFIIDRAVEIAQRYAPAGMLNVGGDIRVWGDTDWLIGIADPRNPSDNAPILGQFTLRNAAVATSGGYARYFNISGTRLSHIIDPRSGWPVADVTSATIIADDCVTANAISTASSVLGASESLDLLEQFANGHLLVGANGRTVRGGAIAMAEMTPAGAAPSNSDGGATTRPADANAAWPKDFQMTIMVAVKPNTGVSGTGAAPAQDSGPGRGGPGARGPGGRRGGPGGGGRRPYVAVWVQDAAGKAIRNIAVWGTDQRYIRELSFWWQAAASASQQTLRAITRATRGAGEYALTWDGLNDAGKPVPQGEYTVVVELNREHGRHVKESVTLTCGADPASGKLKDTAESDASTVEYGPRPITSASTGGSVSGNAN
jgi:thiamine biosynthesis lipoprotein ApbE